MKTTLLLIAKVSILKIPAEAWDAIIPHGPKVSHSLKEYMAAGVVRDISPLVKDQAIASRIKDIGKAMVSAASGGLVQGWEDGDDICPPWPPFPPRKWQWLENEDQEPEPVPWKFASTEQVILADLLMSLSEMTSQRDHSAQLRDAASAIISGVSRRLAKDFARTKQ